MLLNIQQVIYISYMELQVRRSIINNGVSKSLYTVVLYVNVCIGYYTERSFETVHH